MYYLLSKIPAKNLYMILNYESKLKKISVLKENDEKLLLTPVMYIISLLLPYNDTSYMIEGSEKKYSNERWENKLFCNHSIRLIYDASSMGVDTLDRGFVTVYYKASIQFQ